MTSNIVPSCRSCKAFKPTCINMQDEVLEGRCYIAPRYSAVALRDVTPTVGPGDFCRLFEPRPHA